MIAALLLAAGASAAPAQGRLVVLVVVDQLRAADLTWLAPELGPRGFAGMGRPALMRYDTAVTETAADHATLGTGAYAELNGIVGNRYYDGEKAHELVEDPACTVWGTKSLGKSAAMLRVPTVGDAWKLNTNGAGRVVTVSVKDRSALFLGGTSADLALWFEDQTGEMASTRCYAPGPPAWVPVHPAARFKDWVWKPLHPEVLARLVPQERQEGASPEYGIGPQFPHAVGQGKLDRRLYLAVRSSPASTTMVLDAARAAVSGMGLGQRGRTDYLAVALSAVDGVGHQFGSLARERVDVVLRMHEELGAFLAGLRRRFGSRLSVVLTADHGLTPVPADQKRLRVDGGGSEVIEELVPRLERALDDALGPRQGGWVLGIENATVALRRPFPRRAVDVAADLLRKEPGFFRVLPTSDLEGTDAFLRHAVFPGRSGQILLVPRPLWSLKKHSDAADHGSPWNDDAVVPLLVDAPGWRLRRESIFRATQVAPTIAALLGTVPPAAALDVPAIEQQ